MTSPLDVLEMLFEEDGKTTVRMEVPYFQTPNSVFEQRLSISAKIVYIYLCRCANNGGTAFPSYQTIGDKCSISRSTAIKAVRELVRVGLLEKKKRRVSHNENQSNIYLVKTI